MQEDFDQIYQNCFDPVYRYVLSLSMTGVGLATDGLKEGKSPVTMAFSLSRRSVGKWVDGVLSLWVFFYSRAPYPTMSNYMWIPQRFHTGIKSQH